MSTQVPRVLVVWCGVLAWLVGGCAKEAARPPKELTEQVIREKIKTESDGCIKLAAFSLTKPEATEVKPGLYSWDYALEIEFVEDCRWLAEKRAGIGFTEFKVEKLAAGAADANSESLSEEPSNPKEPRRPVMAKGKREKMLGWVYFEQTEQGWKPKMVSIKPETRAQPKPRPASTQATNQP